MKCNCCNNLDQIFFNQTKTIYSDITLYTKICLHNFIFQPNKEVRIWLFILHWALNLNARQSDSDRRNRFAGLHTCQYLNWKKFKMYFDLLFLIKKNPSYSNPDKKKSCLKFWSLSKMQDRTDWTYYFLHSFYFLKGSLG